MPRRASLRSLTVRLFCPKHSLQHPHLDACSGSSTGWLRASRTASVWPHADARLMFVYTSSGEASPSPSTACRVARVKVGAGVGQARAGCAQARHG